MSEFESLPLELLYLILSFLPLESVYKLGSTNKHLYSLITKNQSFWRFKVLKSHGIKIIRDQEPEEESRDIRLPAHPSGMIADSSLEGDREVFLIFSEEFGAFLRHLRSKSEQQSDAAVIGSFFKSLLPRSWGLHRGIHYLSRMDPNFSARLALFGPGIESPKTKLLVHKMVNSHSSVFNALDFVAGLPGGFGSGVRIDFKSIYKFDLMCLYTNSIHVRESHRGVCRLMAYHNKLLTQDALEFTVAEEPMLHQSVLKLLPTLHGLLYAIDVQDLINAGEDKLEEEYQFLRSELSLMLAGLDKTADSSHTPILILTCNSPEETSPNPEYLLDLDELAQQLGLNALDPHRRRPWAIFNVNIADMSGMTKALEWILYHIQKRKCDLEFHQSNSQQ